MPNPSFEEHLTGYRRAQNFDIYIPDSVITHLIKKNGVRAIEYWYDRKATAEEKLINYFEFDRNGNQVAWVRPYGSGYSKVRYEYNEKRQRVKKITYNPSDTSKVNGWTNYLYNSNGYQSQSKTHNVNDTATHKIISSTTEQRGDTLYQTTMDRYIYNWAGEASEKDKKVLRLWKSGDVVYRDRLTYDKHSGKIRKASSYYQIWENKRLIEEGEISYNMEEFYEKMITEYPNRAMKVMEMISNGTIYKFVLSGQIKGEREVRVTYTYNQKGQLLTEVQGDFIAEAYVYNANGELIEMSTTTEGGSIDIKSYEYDGKGLPTLIKSVITNKGGTRHSVARFKYVYY